MIETLFHLLFGYGVSCALFDPLTIASLAMSLGGGIASLSGSANLNKKRQNNLDRQASEAEAFHNKEQYTDELSRSENASMLRELTSKLQDQTKQNQSTAAITGATPEAVVAQQANMGKTIASVVNQMAGRASQRKDIEMRNYRADKRALYGMQDSLDQGKAATWQNLGVNAGQLGSNAIGIMGTSTPKIAGVGKGILDPNALGDGLKNEFDVAAQTLSA